MKISIVTATYNSAATVRDTLESIASQTYENIEHIIIDGVSSDQTLDIVAQYPHVAKVSSEKDKGIYDAMNKGIQIATGEVIGILNSDDFYDSNQVIENVMRFFEDQTVDAVYGDLQYVHPRDTSKIVRTWKSGEFNKRNFYLGWMPPHPSFFVRKKAYEQFGYFNLALKTAADYEIMLRFLFKNDMKVKYLPQVLVKMRTGGVSNISIWNRIKANREDRLAWHINGIKPRFFTLVLKPLRKINQFVIK